MTWAPNMYRWGTGTPTIPGYLVARPGHDLIRQVGVQNIREHNVRLTTMLAEMALERGLQVNTPLEPEKRTGWIGIALRGSQGDTERVYHELVNRRVFVDYRPGCGLRVSPHYYTTEDEIGAFFAAVEELT